MRIHGLQIDKLLAVPKHVALGALCKIASLTDTFDWFGERLFT